MTLEELNALDAARAERELLRCCGARRWARDMVARRPFRDLQAVERDADNIWRGLGPADWLEAFAAHPRIGDAPESGGAGGAGEWSSREQAGMDAATGELRQRLAAANREYEDRFGFIYIVCATGKTADEMLASVERRLQCSRDEELLTAANEQRQIMQIRLAHLMA